MDRWACVDTPVLPLQLLLRARPELRGHPTVLADEDTRPARVLIASVAARRAGVSPGMTVPAASALCPGLEVAPLDSDALRQGNDEIAGLLRAFSPRVEPLPLAGVFLLDPAGLERLFGPEQQWAEHILSALEGQELRSYAALASSRMAAFALARGARLLQRRKAARVVALPLDREQEKMGALPLRILGLPEETDTILQQLGIRTVGQFIALPGAGLGRRFGEAAARLRRALLGDDRTPLHPSRPLPPFESFVEVDPPDFDSERLLFLARRALHPLLARLAEQGRAVARLTVSLEPGTSETLQPNQPTLDDRLLSDLLRLLLNRISHEASQALSHGAAPMTSDQPPKPHHQPSSSLPAGENEARMPSPSTASGSASSSSPRIAPTRQFSGAIRGGASSSSPDDVEPRKAALRSPAAEGASGHLSPAAPVSDDEPTTTPEPILVRAVEGIRLLAESVPASAEQLVLFAGRGRENADAVSRAIARLRASYGPSSVRRARLEDDHVPERAFSWEPLQRIAPAKSATSVEPPGPLSVIRAYLPHPADLSGDTPIPFPNRVQRRLDEGERLQAPSLLLARWWEDEIDRVYHFVPVSDDRILWVFRDRRREQWFLQGSL